MACLSYFIVHSPRTRDAPMYTKLEWIVHCILSFTVHAHATLRRIQNLNGLSIVFQYRSHFQHMLGYAHGNGELGSKGVKEQVSQSILQKISYVAYLCQQTAY